MFFGQKIDKFGTDSKLFDQVSFRSNVVSIKYRFDQNVVSIKCRFIQVSFDHCRSINCRVTRPFHHVLGAKRATMICSIQTIFIVYFR